jgi:integrase
MQNDGKGYSTIRTIRGVLRPAFQLAVDDDLIRKNPFAFELMSVIYNDSVIREAISHEDERKFLNFVQDDKHFCKYYDGIYILLNTGLRISEFVGLTLADIDFVNMKINVDHQLQRYNGIGYKIVEPKTDSGVRQIPMTEEVAECFKRVIKNRKTPKIEPIIDGYAGFLWLDRSDNPMVAMHWEKYFQHICEKYNSIYKLQIPRITPHVCRHTFCSRMASARMNPKTLQYIMGHSDISVTLNTYTHLGFEDASQEVKRISKEKSNNPLIKVV